MPIVNALAALVLSGTLLVHGDYPTGCCDNTHCRPVPCTDIVKLEQPDYPPQWRHGTTLFSANSIRAPIDDRCHVCKSEISGYCIMFPRPKTS